MKRVFLLALAAAGIALAFVVRRRRGSSTRDSKLGDNSRQIKQLTPTSELSVSPSRMPAHAGTHRVTEAEIHPSISDDGDERSGVANFQPPPDVIHVADVSDPPSITERTQGAQDTPEIEQPDVAPNLPAGEGGSADRLAMDRVVAEPVEGEGHAESDPSVDCVTTQGSISVAGSLIDTESLRLAETAILAAVSDPLVEQNTVGVQAAVAIIDLSDPLDPASTVERTGSADQNNESDASLKSAGRDGSSAVARPATDLVIDEAVDCGESQGQHSAPTLRVEDRTERADAGSATLEKERQARTPRQYQPPRSTTPRPATRRAPSSASSPSSERSLDIEVRLIFERGGFCRISLMPGKDDNIGEIVVAGTTGEVELVPLQDDLYSDVFPLEVGALLRDGVEWAATLQSGARLRWSLTGREVYVLGADERVSGYLSMPRVLLGADHVVLCTDEIAPQAAKVIEESGSPLPTAFGSAEGLPDGWTGFRGVSPAIPIPQTEERDILNVLHARPDISIVLEGGIRIGRSTWLAEFPPNIRIRGDASTTRGVLIDGIHAVATEAGTYVVSGCESVGSHTVTCGDKSRTYEVRPGLEQWDGWDAYRWSLEGVGADGVQARPALCGPVVRAPRRSASDPDARVVATRNAVLVGAAPGAIVHASMRGIRRGVASVGFEPVWALPSDPFHADKRVTRVIGLANIAPLVVKSPLSGRRDSVACRAWCDAILDSSRKGLAIEPNDPERIALWAAYRRYAKVMRKRLR